MTTENKIPDFTDGRSSAGNIFDNWDSTIDLGTIETIVSDPEKYAFHGNRGPWWGYVIYTDGKFHEQVKKSGDVVDVFEADTPEQLMSMVNDKYGWD